MSIVLNDNIKINAGKPSESKYLTPTVMTYTGTSQVFTNVPLTERHIGLTVNINNEEYWFKDGLTNGDLVIKSSGGGTGTLTGATNGLSVQGANVVLGGTLTGDTTIDIPVGNSIYVRKIDDSGMPFYYNEHGSFNGANLLGSYLIGEGTGGYDVNFDGTDTYHTSFGVGAGSFNANAHKNGDLDTEYANLIVSLNSGVEMSYREPGDNVNYNARLYFGGFEINEYVSNQVFRVDQQGLSVERGGLMFPSFHTGDYPDPSPLIYRFIYDLDESVLKRSDGSEWIPYGAVTFTGGTNGLSVQGSNVVLGGTLTGDTNIDGDYTYNFNLGSNSRLSNINLQADSTIYAEAGNGTYINMEDNRIQLHMQIDDTPDLTRLDLNSEFTELQSPALELIVPNVGRIVMEDEYFYIKDERSGSYQSGIQYDSDYSANFTALSLVNAGWVTGITSTLTGGTGTLTGATNGLSVQGANVVLGGTLTGNTLIEGSTGLTEGIQFGNVYADGGSKALSYFTVDVDEVPGDFGQRSNVNFSVQPYGISINMLSENIANTIYPYYNIQGGVFDVILQDLGTLNQAKFNLGANGGSFRLAGENSSYETGALIESTGLGGDLLISNYGGTSINIGSLDTGHSYPIKLSTASGTGANIELNAGDRIQLDAGAIHITPTSEFQLNLPGSNYGDMYYRDAYNNTVPLYIGYASQYLGVSGDGIPEWQSISIPIAPGEGINFTTNYTGGTQINLGGVITGDTVNISQTAAFPSFGIDVTSTYYNLYSGIFSNGNNAGMFGQGIEVDGDNTTTGIGSIFTNESGVGMTHTGVRTAGVYNQIQFLFSADDGAIFLDIRDRKCGIEYTPTTDIIEDYNKHTLVSKHYVTGLTASITYNFENGLTQSDNDVSLGGVLTDDITIDGDGSSDVNIINLDEFRLTAGSISISGYTTIGGNVSFDKTLTPGGTTGAQTINKVSGQVNFAAGASTLVVTNSYADTDSNILVTVYGTDTTATSARVTRASGSFTITLNAAATAETAVGFFVFN